MCTENPEILRSRNEAPTTLENNKIVVRSGFIGDVEERGGDI